MNVIHEIEKSYRKPGLPQVQTGDTVRVHQRIVEGTKSRIQVFEGVIIRRHRLNELSASITVRRIASGVGVEKTFLLHSPNVDQVQIMRRAKVRRNFLSYLRDRRGKSARLKEIGFDKAAANAVPEAVADADLEEEIDADQNEDALNNAEPLTEVEKAEDKQAAAEDTDEIDTDQSGDHESGERQEQETAEVEQGEDRAEPGEGDAVQS